MTNPRVALAERIIVALATGPLSAESVVDAAVDLANEAYARFESEGWLIPPPAPLPPGVAPPPPKAPMVVNPVAPLPPRWDLDDEIPF